MLLENIELFPQNKHGFEIPSAHFEMLHDLRRIDAYQRAIREIVKPGDIVVDAGTGTGLLAFLAIQAGASHVHAIEETLIIKTAREIAQANNLSDRVTFYHANSKTVELAQQADVLVTETIGHLAFEEQILETMLDARRRLLRPEGKIIPQRLTLQAAPVAANEIYRFYLERWKERICGLDFSVMRRLAANNIYIADFQVEHLLSIPHPAFSFDFLGDNCLNTHSTIFDIHRNETLHGFLFWFDA